MLQSMSKTLQAVSPGLHQHLRLYKGQLQGGSTQDAATGEDSRSLPLASQLPPGRLIELPAATPTNCHMTQAVASLRYAQHCGKTCAWVQIEGGSLYPPDLADNGIDLAALVVVHVPRRARHAGLAKAAEILLRSGGFGMVIVDLWGIPSDRPSPLQTAWQGRLFGMAREHNSWLILLSSPKVAPHKHAHPRSHREHGGTPHFSPSSLGPLISLRVAGERRRLAPGHFAITPIIEKDKSGCLSHRPLAEEYRRGPWGLY